MAELTETFYGSVAPHMQKTGRALRTCVYQVVKAAQNDTCAFGDFTQLVHAQGFHTSNAGTVENLVLSSVTANGVDFKSAQTGTIRLIVVGY